MTSVSLALPCMYLHTIRTQQVAVWVGLAAVAMSSVIAPAHAQLTGLAVQQSSSGLQVVLHDSQQASPVSVQSASYGQVVLKLSQANLPPTLMVNTEEAPLVSHVLVEQSPNGDALITLQGHKLSSPTLLWQVPAMANSVESPLASASPLASFGWLKPLAKQALSALLQPVTALAMALLALLTGVALWAGRSMASAVKAEAASAEATPASALPNLPTQGQGLRFSASRYATQPATVRQAKATPATVAPAVTTPLPVATSLKQSQGLQRYGQVAATAPTPVVGKAMTRPSTVRTVRDTLPSTVASSKVAQASSATGSAKQQQRHAFLEAMAAHAQTQGHANLAHALRLNQR